MDEKRDVKFTKEEIELIKSLHVPVRNVNMILVNSIINKFMLNKEHEKIIYFLNTLNDFAETPDDFVNKLIKDNNKECIATFLENKSILYFISEKDIKKLEKFIDAYEVNIILDKPYKFYYDLLFKQGVRLSKTNEAEHIKEYFFTRYNREFKIRLKDIKGVGLVVSYINYKNYYLSKEEQLKIAIEYINEYGFNIENNELWQSLTTSTN